MLIVWLSRVVLALALLLATGCKPEYNVPESDTEQEQEPDDDNDEDGDGWKPGGKEDLFVTPTEPTYPEGDFSISELQGLYRGGSMQITSSATVTGVVTANDKRGEFEDCIVIQDVTGAIKIMMDIDNSASRYPFGTLVTLSCDGLYLSEYYGGLVLSGKPEDGGLTPLAEMDWKRRLQFKSLGAQCVATAMSISDLTNPKLFTYVAIKSLRFATQHTTFCERDGESGRYVTTRHTLYDRSWDKVSLYVPSSVDYARDELPQGEVTIYAIVDGYLSGQYTLRLIDLGISSQRD